MGSIRILWIEKIHKIINSYWNFKNATICWPRAISESFPKCELVILSYDKSYPLIRLAFAIKQSSVAHYWSDLWLICVLRCDNLKKKERDLYMGVIKASVRKIRSGQLFTAFGLICSFCKSRNLRLLGVLRVNYLKNLLLLGWFFF